MGVFSNTPTQSKKSNLLIKALLNIDHLATAKKWNFLSDRLKCPFISAPVSYTKVSKITWKWKLQTKSFQTGQNLALG